MTRVTHFGPSLEHVGGMASVIAAYVRHQMGADTVTSVATYVPTSTAGSAWLVARAMRRLMTFKGPHVAHVHLSKRGSFIREGAVVAFARARGIPVVISIHGPSFAPFAGRRPSTVTRVLAMAQAVIVLSDEDLNAVRELLPDCHVELVPNPAPVDDAAPPVSATAELALFAGEIGHRKGADVLVEAWASVARERPDARCIMVGPLILDPPPMAERLEIRPPADADAVSDLIHQARVVVLPSRREALPMILTEAMAAGRPFISTPTGGIRSLEDGGILVPVGDASALSDALSRLLSDPAAAQQIGSRGQTLCRETRSAAALDARLRVLYADALARRGRRRESGTTL
jgi:glycosyltransferase involved in cell wall biosynthesis